MTAVKLARCEQGRLWLIHVASPEPDFVGLDIGPKSVRDWRAVQLREEHREIQQMALEIEQRDVDVTPLLVQGPTAETILAEADKLGVDLIVMGSHGHGALYHVLLGSISEAVLHKAPCPIVLVPASTGGDD